MDDGFKGSERRKHIRVGARFILEYFIQEPIEVTEVLGNRKIDAVMTDICVGGMAFVTEQNLPPLSLLQIRFTLIDTREPSENRIAHVELRGEVRHCRKMEKNSYFVGVRFTRIPDGYKNIISRFVQNNKDKGDP